MPEDQAGNGSDAFVTISRAELESLRSRASSTDPSAADSTITALEERYAKEAETRDKKTAELEQAYRSALRERELIAGLAGKPLVPGAIAQLAKLWKDDFDVVEIEGQLQVADRDGRLASQAIAERLAKPEYAHFHIASSRGGAGSRDAHRADEERRDARPPRNLGEAAVFQWRQAAASRQQETRNLSGWGRR